MLILLLSSLLTAWAQVPALWTEQASPLFFPASTPAAADEQLRENATVVESDAARRRLLLPVMMQGPLFWLGDGYDDQLATLRALSWLDAVILMISAFVYYRCITSQRVVQLRPANRRGSFLSDCEGYSSQNSGSIYPSEESARPKQPDFRTPPFSCYDSYSTEYFLYAVCCTIPRIADTVHTVGLGDFWCLILAWVFMHLCLSWMGVLGGAFYIILPGFLSVMRHRLRAAMGIDHATLTSSDILMSLFCSFCVVVQEAREVDMASNSRVACCCRLVTDDVGCISLVGEAFETQLSPAPAPPT